MSQNQRCSNRTRSRPRNRKKYNGVEDENEYDDEYETKGELNPLPATFIRDPSKPTKGFRCQFSAVNCRTREKRTAEPQNVEYRMSKGGIASLCLLKFKNGRIPYFDPPRRNIHYSIFVIRRLNLTWATLNFVGWVEHTLSFVGFRFTQPNLHFISSIAQCETQQQPILEPSPLFVFHFNYPPKRPASTLNPKPCLPCEARRAKKGTVHQTKNSSTTIASRI